MPNDDDLNQIANATFDELMDADASQLGAVSEEETESEGADEDDSSPDGEEPSAGKRDGTDTVLSRLKSSDPEAYRVLRSMQQTVGRNINETRTLQQQLVDALERVVDRREEREDESGEAADDKKLPDGVTEDNIKLFKQVADYLGYVPREELDTRDRESRAGDYVQSALQEGVELFGEDFGELDSDGNITVNPELRPSLEKHLQRLRDGSRGVTPLDLFLLEQGRRALSRARKAGGTSEDTDTSGESKTSTSRPVRRANVARRSSGGGRKLSIYDPKRGDSGEDVFARAWALARRGIKNY